MPPIQPVLVTGGAGYIGSHAVRMLLDRGRQVVVVDDLSRGHRAAVDCRATFYSRNLSDADFLTDVLRTHAVDAVLHFAGIAYVGESVREPVNYYDRNFAASVGLLTAMQRAHVNRLVYSSTCATYGIPASLPILEDTPQTPVSPYGRSKWFVEQMIRDAVAARRDLGVIILRYFNVAGCSADGSLGEDHDPETHIIPLLIKTALGQRAGFSLFGSDYPTPDGTCIRDYVHVDDLCDAHRLAVENVRPGSVQCFNLGLERGYSVAQVIRCVEQVTGCEIPVVEQPRRPGDPPELVASATRVRQELGWQPKFTELHDIVQTAWNWFREHPNGYQAPSGKALPARYA